LGAETFERRRNPSSGASEKADRRRAASANDAEFYDFSESAFKTKDNITQKKDGARTPSHNFRFFGKCVRKRGAALERDENFAGTPRRGASSLGNDVPDDERKGDGNKKAVP
jgi:hypothetical protein